MTAWLHTFRSLPVIGLLIGLLAGLACIGLRHLGALEKMELTLYDWMLQARPAVARADTRIVLIAFTEGDIRRFGRWPISDATLAEALDQLRRASPRVIGLDIYRDLDLDSPGRNRLTKILSSHPEIIIIWKPGAGLTTTIPPPSVLRSNTKRFGFSDFVSDRDGVIRRGLLFLDFEVPLVERKTSPVGKKEPIISTKGPECIQQPESRSLEELSVCNVRSFALQVVSHYLGPEGIVLQPDPAKPEYLRLGRTTLVPLEATDGGYAGDDARGYQILMDYGAALTEPATFTLSELLDGQVDEAILKDRIVLVGSKAVSTENIFATPFDVKVFGVQLHAEIVQQLLRAALQGKSVIATTAEWQVNLGTVLCGLLGGAVAFWMRSAWRFVIVTGGGVLALGAAAWLAILQGFWLPAIQPTLAWLVSFSTATAAGFQHERRQRDQLMQLFAQHVSPEVAEQVWQKRDQFLDGQRPRPKKMTATVLFSDLQGYTSVAEGMEPQKLLDWINAYMAALTDVIIAHHGVIDDYAGDGIKANFGVPLPRVAPEEIQDDARRAVGCALAMQEVLERLNARSQSRGLPTVGMRIGICTGPVVAGSLGSAQRLKYTTIGDTVNSAARLESLDRDRFVPADPNNPCRILIEEATAGYLAEQFRLERVGEISVKGKERPLIAYRVMGSCNTAGAAVTGEAVHQHLPRSLG